MAHPRVTVPISGAATEAPGSGELEVTVVPTPRVLGSSTFTVRAVDRVTRAPVAGRVMITNPQVAEVEAGPTNAPITFSLRRVQVGRPPDIQILLPSARIIGLPAPYRDTDVNLFGR